MREKLAELAHKQWSGWMKYLFSKSNVNVSGGCVLIPAWAAKRWTRQMNTPYSELPEEEKESDREEADKILAVINSASKEDFTCGCPICKSEKS